MYQTCTITKFNSIELQIRGKRSNKTGKKTTLASILYKRNGTENEFQTSERLRVREMERNKETKNRKIAKKKQKQLHFFHYALLYTELVHSSNIPKIMPFWGGLSTKIHQESASSSKLSLKYCSMSVFNSKRNQFLLVFVFRNKKKLDYSML